MNTKTIENPGIFDRLEAEKGSPLTNSEKLNVLNLLELPKSQNGLYLDAFGREVSYNGIATLKRQYVKLPLSETHINEIKVCSQDLFYFVRNYCKILTKSGIEFPEFREYQTQFLETLATGDDVIASLPRQCVEYNTEIVVNNVPMRIGSLFEYAKEGNQSLGACGIFVDSYKVKNIYVLTPRGSLRVKSVHKTKEFKIYKAKFENGLSVSGSAKHVFIDVKGDEVYLENSLGVSIQTSKGVSRVIDIEFLRVDNCYDISMHEYHLYYTNGVLSHNSGKSVTSGLFLLWKSLFTPNINIGIAANKLSLAMEVLDKVKKVFIELPIWLQQGVTAWNKTFIEFENGTRIMTSATNSDAFRGFSCIEKDEILTVYDKLKKHRESITIQKLYDIFEPDRFLIPTHKGLKAFKGVLKSILTNGYELTFDDSTKLKVTGTHKLRVNKTIFRQVEKLKVGDKVLNKKLVSKEKISNTEFYDLFDVEETHSYLHKGLIHHNCHMLLVDECAFVPTTLWEELTDSLFPAQDALAQKQKVLISTPNGTNHWYHLVTAARNGTNGYRFFTSDWRQVPRYNKDGSVKDPDDFKAEIIKKNGKQFFAQNYALEFLGSSSTLISSEALKTLTPMKDEEVLYNTLFDGLRIFKDPEAGHSYVLGVDPKKEGVDRLAMQVIDVTNVPFVQVAAYNGDMSYLNAPAKIFDLGTHYNDAFVVVENNIDNSIVDTLFYQYDYEGDIYRDENKTLLGFRTTTKTKKILLSLLKKLVEESKLEIYDKKTIDEFFVFVEQKNGSFSAEEGYHDDLVMSLMIALAPFINIKHFDDFRGFIDFVEKKRIEEEAEAEEFAKFFSGASFSTDITDADIGMLDKETLSFNY